MTSTIDTTPFQSLLDDGVAKGVAPGFQCVVFDSDSLIFNGVSGLASVPTAENPSGTLFKANTLVLIASCSKISLSLIVLHLIERGLTKSGFSMMDLDNHEALIKVLPEFNRGSGSLVTKIIDGFEDKLDGDGKRVMRLRDAKGRVTLRMLLTHTAGIAYPWNAPLISQLYSPSDGSTPHFASSNISGSIRDFEVPLANEPNTTYNYGYAADWLGQFAVRASGKSLRELYKEIIFQPLGIPPSEADLWISPSLSDSQAFVHMRDSDNGWIRLPHEACDPYSTEGMPPEGKAYYASGPVVCSLQAYAKVLQAVIRQDPLILSKEVWEVAMKDDIKSRGLKVPRPLWKARNRPLGSDVEEFAKSTVDDGAGVNMLQCHVALAPTVSGRPEGSFAWAGALNTYFFIDMVKGVGAIFGTQTLPFCDPQIIEMRDKLEGLVYRTLY